MIAINLRLVGVPRNFVQRERAGKSPIVTIGIPRSRSGFQKKATSFSSRA